MKCDICETEFIGRKGRYPARYCSDDCSYKGQLKRQLEWKHKERQKSRMKWLVNHQEFAPDIPLEKECWVCGSIENLIGHHVRYTKVLKKTLCRTCHEFLHHALLKQKKCRPNGTV
jgi:hypothetical protein